MPQHDQQRAEQRSGCLVVVHPSVLFLDVKGLHGGQAYASRRQSAAVISRAARVDAEYRAGTPDPPRSDQQQAWAERF